jgi:hypothetical protein
VFVWPSRDVYEGIGQAEAAASDYAVNFGMARTEQAWRNHLIRDGGLASSVSFEWT